jgi:hypothetical protein
LIGPKHQIFKADGLDPDYVVSPTMLDRSLAATLLPPVPRSFMDIELYRVISNIINLTSQN